MSTIRVGNIGPLTGNTSVIADPGVSGGGTSLVSQTIAASGTSSIAFTNIPSWTRRITISFGGLVYASSENTRIRIGSGGSLQSTGYGGAGGWFGGVSSGMTNSVTTGMDFYGENYNTAKYGICTLILANPSSYTWVYNGWITTTSNPYIFGINGGVSLSGVLTNLSILGLSGGNMNSGSVTCLYE
jgi:hypothetical protein